MKRFVFLAGIAALTSGIANAQSSTNPAAIQPGSYAIEPGHTQIAFSVLHFGFTHYHGLFSSVSGSLKLDPKNPESGALSVTIPVSSVQTTSAQLNGELKGQDWFDAGKFPEATFVSTKIKRTSSSDAIVVGTLTLHGVSKPETLTVHFLGGGLNPINKHYTVGFEAKGTIKRSAFGVTKYVPYVSDDVALTIAGAFEKQN